MFPFGDWIMVEREEPSKMAGGIELPDSADPRFAIGKIVGINHDPQSEKISPVIVSSMDDLEEGDRIVFEFYAAVQIDDIGIEEKGLFIKKENIIATL